MQLMYLTARIKDQLGFNRPETYTAQLGSYGIMPQNSFHKNKQLKPAITGYNWL